MTLLVKGKKRRRRVTFKRRAMAGSGPSLSSSPTSTLDRTLYGERSQRPGFIMEDTEAEDQPSFEGGIAYRPKISPSTMSAKTARASLIPELFTSLPQIRDLLHTGTSRVQDETIQECLPFLSGAVPNITCNDQGVPHLDRKRHIQYLHKSLQKLPAPFVAADASRPWMFYWALAGLSVMGEDISQYREKVISTCRPIQNATGGFGGGNGQMSHLAPTYAIVLSLSMVGGKEALDLIDRKAMWKWLGALKQHDGGFQMSVGGEEDIRGAYCVAVIISLLNLPLELPKDSPAWSREGSTLVANLPEWVARCQTFEGGISARPDAEAHGAYAFCALACLCILGDPQAIMPKYLDVPRLISWLSARQYAPEGGFAGRTNKLVDGCYSHWVGGCWPLVQACLDGRPSLVPASAESTAPLTPAPPVGSLYSREGLIRYILCCCQDQTKRGGLRDKPSHTSDAYHTCYVLAGLSSAQHKWHFDISATERQGCGILNSAYQWTPEPIIQESQIYDEEDRIGILHPIFVVPEGVAEETRAYFASKDQL